MTHGHIEFPTIKQGFGSSEEREFDRETLRMSKFTQNASSCPDLHFLGAGQLPGTWLWLQKNGTKMEPW